MSERFGCAALKLCHAANALLGWRPDEFWNATPAELSTALIAPAGHGEAPDPALIAELLRRFPDE